MRLKIWSLMLAFTIYLQPIYVSSFVIAVIRPKAFSYVRCQKHYRKPFFGSIMMARRTGLQIQLSYNEKELEQDHHGENGQTQTLDSSTSTSRPNSTYTINNRIESLLEHTSLFTDEVLNDAVDLFSKLIKPNAKSYILLIQIYGKCNKPQEAQNLLYEMLSNYRKTKNEKIKPNTIAFTSAIDAWSQSSDRRAPYKAEKLLEQMLELYNNESVDFGDDVRPNSITFDSVLHAFSRSNKHARSAESVLEKMDYFRRNSDWDVKPNVVSFTNVVNAWINEKGKNAQRAQEVMERMEEIYQLTKDKDLKLNTIIMNSVMDGWAKESNWKKAMAILHRMEELYEKTPNYLREKNNPTEIIKPNIISYNIALKALVNGKQIKKAQSLFLQMQSFTDEDQMPNTRTYNTILSGYSLISPSKSSESQNITKDAATKATLILTKQISLFKEGNIRVKPDTVSFTTCMNVIAKSKTYPNKAKKSKEILDLMWDLKKGENSKEQPNDHFSPNIITYNTVLNAAAFSAFTDEAEIKEAFLVALSTFNELRNLNDTSIQPDEVTYGNMLKICANLLPRSHPQRNNLAKELWRGACESGLVGDLVWNELKRAVPVDLLQELIPKHASRRRDLPWKWRKNVKVEMIENKRYSKEVKTRKKDFDSDNDANVKQVPNENFVRITRFSEYM